MLALIAGQGRLPAAIREARPDALVAELEGFPSGLEPVSWRFRIERLGSFLAELKSAGVTDVCFAGAIRRPPLDPSMVDAATIPIVPRMMVALQSGDDAALRTVLDFFEEAGIAVRPAQELAPDLLAQEGILGKVEPSDQDRRDAARAAAIVEALGAADVGQGCVVAGGQALALEAFGGTDWMLASLADDRRPLGPTGGVLYKAPKPGQDRRVDLPAIGPQTVAGAVSAGLSGIVVEAGGVLLLDREDTVAAADEAGLFLWARTP